MASLSVPMATGSPAATRFGSGLTSPKPGGQLSTAGRTLLRARSSGSLGSPGGTQLRGFKTAGQDSAMWSTMWRPAPEHLVADWHSLGGTAKGAVMQAKEDVQRGEVQAYLCNRNLGDNGTFLIADILQGARLRTVNLQSNKLGDAGAARLAEVLTPMVGLQVLCLSDNCIGDPGATSLSSLVEYHPNLNLLSLERNLVGDCGTSRLLTALGHNLQRKTEVVLTSNPVRRLDPGALHSLSAVAESVDRLSQVGVTLGTLLQIYTDGVASGDIRPRSTTTGEVVQKLLLPACAVALKSYSEAVTPSAPPPVTQVIHAWDALFEDLVRSVARHASGRRSVEVLDPSHHDWCYSPEWTGKPYFIDAFCVNQHAHLNVRQSREYSRFTERPYFALGSTHCQVDRLDLVAHQLVHRGGRLLLAVDSSNTLLTRIHCLYELHQALEDHLPLDVVFAGVRFFPKSRRAEMVQTAEASIHQMRQRILDLVRDGPGGYERFNQVVLEFLDKNVDREFGDLLTQFESKGH